MKEAFCVLIRMDKDGCEAELIIYIVLIDSLCNAGKLDRADEILLKMKASNHKPDRVTHTTLLDKWW